LKSTLPDYLPHLFAEKLKRFTLDSKARDQYSLLPHFSHAVNFIKSEGLFYHPCETFQAKYFLIPTSLIGLTVSLFNQDPA